MMVVGERESPIIRAGDVRLVLAEEPDLTAPEFFAGAPLVVT